MKMNNLFKKSFLMFFALLSVMLVSCKDDDDETEVVLKPTVTAINPTSGEPGTAVTLTGTNLGDATSVTFGSASAIIGSKTATSIVTTVPANAAEGAQTITVTTPGGTATISFTVEGGEVVEVPAITAVDPAEAAVGAEVTITGTNLENAIVTFGEVAAVITANTATSITTSVPANAEVGELEISVITAGGTATHAFEVVVETGGEEGERFYVHNDGVVLDNGFREHGGNDHHEPLDRANTEQFLEGESAIKFVSKKSPNAQFGFHLDPHGTIMDTGDYTHLVFSVYGGEGAGNMRVSLREKQENGNDVAQANIVRASVTPVVGEWTTFEVPLTTLGTKVGEGDAYTPSGQFGSIKWFEMMFDSHGTSEGGDIRTFYIDEIYFVKK